ncbi:hypothetical protein GW17_00059085 [Ensete ventricosum]|nr:hypothetical protein GW17_00059085 [Ensete ventricosum]
MSEILIATEHSRRVEPERLHGIRDDIEKKRDSWGGACGPPAEVSVVGLDVEKPALFLYDRLELPKKQAAARVSRLRSMVVMQRVAGAEAAVAGGTTEKGRMISPPKDNDERPQEGAMCGRWGGAVDRLPRKIGEGDCGGRGGVEEVCLLVAARGSGCRRCWRKQIASSSRGPRLRLKKRATAVAEEERRELSFGSTVAQATAVGDGGMRRQQDEVLSTAVEESGRLVRFAPSKCRTPEERRNRDLLFWQISSE